MASIAEDILRGIAVKKRLSERERMQAEFNTQIKSKDGLPPARGTSDGLWCNTCGKRPSKCNCIGGFQS